MIVHREPTILFCYGECDDAIQKAREYCTAEGHTEETARIRRYEGNIEVVTK